MRKEPPISKIDLDMTNNCVLACDYCFRGEKNPRKLTWEVGSRAIDWLIEKSQNEKKLSVSLFGGEPLMEFKLIKQLVPYAKEKVAECGKTIHFTAVTNSVLVTDEIIEFFRKYDMTFHTSIDGGPETQDAHRHFPNGSGSSAVIEPNIKKILKYWPNRTARSTISSDVVHRWLEDVKYLVDLGYKRLAMILIPDQEWSDEQLEILKSQLRQISDFYIEQYRQGKPIYIKHIEDGMKAFINPTRRSSHCGAGRSLVLIRTDGSIYPCHRFGGEIDAESENKWCLGTIFDDFDHEKRQTLLNLDCRKHVKADCENCMAVHMCGISCIAINWSNFKDIYKPHPRQCKFNNLFAKEAMRVHYILDSERNKLFTEKFHPERLPKKRTTVQRKSGPSHMRSKINGPEAVFVMLGSGALSPCFMFNGKRQRSQIQLSVDQLKNTMKWATQTFSVPPNLFFLTDDEAKLDASIAKFLGNVPEQVLVPLMPLQRQKELQIPFSEHQAVIAANLTQLVAEKESISERSVIAHVAPDEIEQMSDLLVSIKDRIPQITLRLKSVHELTDAQIATYKDQLNTLRDVLRLESFIGLNGIRKLHLNGSNRQSHCPAGRQLITVGPDGLIYPCPTFYANGSSGRTIESLKPSKNGDFSILETKPGCVCDSEKCPGCEFIKLSNYENGTQICSIYKAEMVQ